MDVYFSQSFILLSKAISYENKQLLTSTISFSQGMHVSQQTHFFLQWARQFKKKPYIIRWEGEGEFYLRRNQFTYVFIKHTNVFYVRHLKVKEKDYNHTVPVLKSITWKKDTNNHVKHDKCHLKKQLTFIFIKTTSRYLNPLAQNVCLLLTATDTQRRRKISKRGNKERHLAEVIPGIRQMGSPLHRWKTQRTIP